MSVAPPPFSTTYIRIWTALSIVLGFGLLGMFVFGPHLLHAGHIIWDIIRYLASPII